MTAVLAVAVVALGARVDPAAGQARLKIGIIGAGQIGGTLGEHWVKAGHEVLLSSRHPDSLKPLADRLGPLARVGTPAEAAAFGEVVLVSVPYGAFPQVGRDHGEALRGKIVLDPGNPFPGRDGAMAEEARKTGTATASLAHLGRVRLVRAFNTVPASVLKSEARRAGERIAVPLASDDAQALEVAARLVRDAGFEPVIVGALARSKAFDVGTAVFGRGLTARELRRGLGLAP
ncbi:MAG TPA: NAD(P)-binding domain-containing protein [Candidatus Limnocylindria bacterium]|nr:NAD(P)-binding domain-containing protein [Candidatus Limnocylindria bacterium]